MKTILSVTFAAVAAILCGLTFAQDKAPGKPGADEKSPPKEVKASPKGKKKLDLVPLTKEQARTARGGNR